MPNAGHLDALLRALHNLAEPIRGSARMAKINEYLTVGEAAAFLGVSKDTLRRWDQAGKLQAHRHPITRYRLYLRTELDAVLQELRDRPSRERAATSNRKRAKRGERRKR